MSIDSIVCKFNFLNIYLIIFPQYFITHLLMCLFPNRTQLTYLSMFRLSYMPLNLGI